MCFCKYIIFKTCFEIKLVNENSYIISIGRIKLRLTKLQELNKETQKFKTIAELKKC